MWKGQTQRLQGAITTECNGVILLVSLDKVKGGETIHLEAWMNIIGCGIHLGHYHIWVGLGELLGQFLVHGLQALAVATPRGIELHQDIFLRLHHLILKVPSNKYLHWAVLSLRHWLGFQIGLHLAWKCYAEVKKLLTWICIKALWYKYVMVKEVPLDTCHKQTESQQMKGMPGYKRWLDRVTSKL
ncbi:hypothetical protein E2C01_013821 [Portunus trituberculatus]|uniref:Uncharacterized protein n=1 Tax=Portunus trituberculatus TaxID=210409 RepID=A0A5B7DIH7_PORTR|nr:hypothetical protein [Portunus trituberculatus]